MDMIRMGISREHAILTYQLNILGKHSEPSIGG